MGLVNFNKHHSKIFMNFQSALTACIISASILGSVSMLAADDIPSVQTDETTALVDKIVPAFSIASGGDDALVIFRKAIAAMADLATKGVTPTQAVNLAQKKVGAPTAESGKISQLLLKTYELNSARLAEPATLKNLRSGKMPFPPLKKP